jgi:hypothetical protein
MKLKTLAAQCKKKGVFELLTNITADGEVKSQWMGNGSSAFPLVGLPVLTEDNIVAMYDITENQRENMRIELKPLFEHINFTDDDPYEKLVDREKINFTHGKHNVCPVITSSGIEFIDTDLLAPLADCSDPIELYERHFYGMPDGQIYFAVKTGMFIAGIIMPLNIIDEEFVKSVERLGGKLRYALTQKKLKEAVREHEAEAYAQTQIKREQADDEAPVEYSEDFAELTTKDEICETYDPISGITFSSCVCDTNL